MGTCTHNRILSLSLFLSLSFSLSLRCSMHGWHCYIFKTYTPDKLSKLRTTGPRRKCSHSFSSLSGENVHTRSVRFENWESVHTHRFSSLWESVHTQVWHIRTWYAREFMITITHNPQGSTFKGYIRIFTCINDKFVWETKKNIIKNTRETLLSIFFSLSDEGPMLETLDYTIRIGSTPTILYFDCYLYVIIFINGRSRRPTAAFFTNHVNYPRKSQLAQFHNFPSLYLLIFSWHTWSLCKTNSFPNFPSLLILSWHTWSLCKTKSVHKSQLEATDNFKERWQEPRMERNIYFLLECGKEKYTWYEMLK